MVILVGTKTKLAQVGYARCPETSLPAGRTRPMPDDYRDSGGLGAPPRCFPPVRDSL